MKSVEEMSRRDLEMDLKCRRKDCDYYRGQMIEYEALKEKLRKGDDDSRSVPMKYVVVIDLTKEIEGDPKTPEFRREMEVAGKGLLETIEDHLAAALEMGFKPLTIRVYDEADLTLLQTLRP
jgi:hypothetical protein